MSKISPVFPIDETTDFRLVPNIRHAFLSNDFYEFERYSKEIHFFPKETENIFRNTPDDQHLVYWTENHLAGILTSEYLIAQKLGNKLGNNHLEIFLKSRIKYGSSEYLSVAYQAYTIAGLLNIYDFAGSDPYSEELKQMTKKIIDDIVISYAHVVNPYNGKIASAGGRLYSYMRTTTDNLKITPLLYLLVGKDIRHFGMNYTLAYALRTSSYTIPLAAYEIIDQRRNPGIHDYTLRLTKEIPALSSDPMWILWSYGVYISPLRLHQLIHFVGKYHLYDHHHFKSVLSSLKLESRSRRLFLYVLISILFILLSPLMYIVGRSSWLTNAVLTVSTITTKESDVCVITSINSDASGYKAAQQFPAQILLNSETMNVSFGQIESGIKKELSSMSILPYTSIQKNNNKRILKFSFGTYNPIFRWLSRNDILKVNSTIVNTTNNDRKIKINVIKQTSNQVEIEIFSDN
jgi:hypothetical protein